jgi:2,4-dienoyl-CoA reductase (NADPH2)
VLFGPHVTNLGDGRALSTRHLAYYRRRALGGCGTIVVEQASVHESDWPYERAPLAERCVDGWHAIATAGQAEGSLVIAGLGHAGGQGSSAYSQRPLWAPSRVPEVNSREVPKWMEPEDIAAVVDGFGTAAKLAVGAGCDGVEINAGQHSLVRQFLSGLTNQRGDDWGTDRLRLARDVIGAARRAIGADAVVGLRLSCDELAPWAGLKPEDAAGIADELSAELDYLVVVRGSIYTVEQTSPDFHEAGGFNVELCRSIRTAVRSGTAVVLQGSVVDPQRAEGALHDGVADLVEMTRAQIADPDLVRKLADGRKPRPCIRCNQTCQVRDVRNPIVTCVGEPTSGHETEDPDWSMKTARPRSVVVVGGGPAGLECARVAAERGHDVRVIERRDRFGGVAGEHGPGRPLVAWLEDECRRLGVALEAGREASNAGDVAAAEVVVLATGSRPGGRSYDVSEDGVVADVLELGAATDGRERVAIWDPIGGPIAVAVAEALGSRAILITPDAIAGNELSRSGDLAPANVRLQRGGVQIERRSVVRAVRRGEVEVERKYSGEREVLSADVLVDCGHRLPDELVIEGLDRPVLRAGDCIAPRTILEAVLEGRRAALAIDQQP